MSYKTIEEREEHKKKIKEYKQSDKILIKRVRGVTELKITLLEMEESMPEYEVFNICADRGAKGVSATFTIIYIKKN